MTDVWSTEPNDDFYMKSLELMEYIEYFCNHFCSEWHDNIL